MKMAPAEAAMTVPSGILPLPSLPIIDLSPLSHPVSGNADADLSRSKCGEAIRNALSNHGFMYVTGHGVPSYEMDRVIGSMKSFFDANQLVKRTCEACRSPLYRGYNGLDGKHSCNNEDGSGPDVKESFTVGTERSESDDRKSSPMHGPNQWPSEEDLPGWKQSIEEYWQNMTHVSILVMRGMALALGVDEDFFLSRNDDTVSQLVMIRYPPLPKGVARNGGRCGEHTDCGFLTILHQDRPGLEVMSGGKFIQADPIPGAFVVNLGDMCAQWTNNIFKSTLHRVNPAVDSDVSRHSVPFFINCNWDCIVDYRDILREKGNEEGGEFALPVKAGPYMLQKLGLMWLDK